MRVAWLVRVGVVLAAGLLALGAGGPARAAATIPINPGHIGSTAIGFGVRDCTGPFANLPSNKDGWHFVLPTSAGTHFVSVTLAFATPNGEVIVTVTSRDAGAPSTGPGWSGYIDDTGSGEFRHLYFFADAGWTLTAGVAQVDPDGSMGQFNLSSTCPGSLVSSPSPVPSVSPRVEPPASPSPAAAGQPSVYVPTEAPGTGGGGSQGTGLVAGVGALALAGVAAGAGLVVARRRRAHGVARASASTPTRHRSSGA